jgi:voltage-gated potassium channel
MANTFRNNLFRLLDPSALRRHKSSFIVEIIILGLVLINCVIISIETIPDIAEEIRHELYITELIITSVFALEYAVRIYIAPERYTKNLNPWNARLKYIFTTGAIVDFISITPLFFVSSHAGVVRIIKIVRILRILKAVRYMQSLKDFGNVLKSKREELMISFTFILFLLFVVSSVIYVVEHKAQPEVFKSIPHSMWYGVSTLTTVGYGDMYPITPLGKVLGGLAAILGIGLFSLPAGIIAGGFVENINRKRAKSEQDKKHNQPKEYQYCPHCGEKLN